MKASVVQRSNYMRYLQLVSKKFWWHFKNLGNSGSDARRHLFPNSTELPKSSPYTPPTKIRGVTESSLCLQHLLVTVCANKLTAAEVWRREETVLQLLLSLLRRKKKKYLRFPLHLRPAQLDRCATMPNLKEYLPNLALPRKYAQDHHLTRTQIRLPRCSAAPKLRLLLAAGTFKVKKMIAPHGLWGLQWLICRDVEKSTWWLLTHIMQSHVLSTATLFFSIRLGYFCKTKPPNWGFYNYSHRPALLQCKNMKWKACLQIHPWELTAACYIWSTRESWGQKEKLAQLSEKSCTFTGKEKALPGSGRS